MKLLFLDFDGVLNTERNRLPNGYRTLDYDCVQRLCDILRAEPECRIVLTTAWRYMVLGGSMTLRGIEQLLLLAGAEFEDISGRIIGHTCADEAITGEGASYEYLREQGAAIRVEQIRRWLVEHDSIHAFVVLDDMSLDMPEAICVDSDTGLTPAVVQQVVSRLA